MFETQHFLKLTEFQRFYENWRFSACPAVHWVTPRYPFHLKTNSKYHRDRPSEWSRFTEITGSNCKSKPEFYIKLVLLKQLERGILFWPWMNLWNANYTHARTHTPLCSPPSFTLFITLAPSFQAHLVLWAPHKRFPRKRFGHANAQNKKKVVFIFITRSLCCCCRRCATRIMARIVWMSFMKLGEKVRKYEWIGCLC